MSLCLLAIVMSDTDTSASQQDSCKRPSTAWKRPAASRGSGRARVRGRGRGHGRGSGPPSTPPSSTVTPLMPRRHYDCGNDSASEETSASAETRRIRKAEEQWDAGAKGSNKRVKATVDKDSETDTESAECLDRHQDDGPKSSAATEFCKWVVDNKIDPEHLQQAADRVRNGKTIRMGEFCAGMCSGTMAAKIIANAMMMKTGSAIGPVVAWND